MARLSTHVLDTARGKPAAGLSIDLYVCERDGRRHITRVTTNEDGRTDQPLLAGDRIAAGSYELVFHAGPYFRSTGEPLSGPTFLDDVVVRFVLADPSANYHVPLLLSPYGYTTYRGS